MFRILNMSKNCVHLTMQRRRFGCRLNNVYLETFFVYVECLVVVASRKGCASSLLSWWNSIRTAP
jgi:hypothetical protein